MSEIISIQKTKDGWEVKIGDEARVYVFPSEAAAFRKVKEALAIEVAEVGGV